MLLKSSKIISSRIKNRRPPFQNTAEFKKQKIKWSSLQATENKEKEGNVKPGDKNQPKYICYNQWKLVKCLLRDKYPDKTGRH